jgi:methionine-rich copper-binding protein CopC
LPTRILHWIARRVTIAALAGLALVPAAAWAHAILEQSQPVAGASVSAGNVGMIFRYNSRIDRARSRLTLIRPDHSQTVLRIGPASEPNVLETSATLIASGNYVVRWQVLAVDGHITRGDVPFTVTGP